MQGVIGHTSIPAWNPVLTFYILAITSTSLDDFLFLREMIGGSLKIWQSSSWCCIHIHVTFQALHKGFFYSSHWGLILCHKRQYFFFLLVILFQECRLPFCEIFSSDSRFSIKVQCMWEAFAHQVFFRHLKYFPQTLFLRSLFIGFSRLFLWPDPILTLGRWQEGKCVNKKVPVCWKCVFTLCVFTPNPNLVPLYTTVPINSLSVIFWPWI